MGTWASAGIHQTLYKLIAITGLGKNSLLQEQTDMLSWTFVLQELIHVKWL
jgi:hypothetical protein